MHWCLHSENSCSSLGEGPKCCELTCSCGNSKCKSCHAEKLHHGLLQHTGTTCEQNSFFSSSLRINLVCESSALKQKSSRQGRVKADTRCFSCASAHRKRARRSLETGCKNRFEVPCCRLYSLLTPREELLHLQPRVSG